MRGNIGGVQRKILDLYPKALYVHCASHCLNLALTKASSIPDIRNMCGTIQEIIAFFSMSPKRKALLQSFISQYYPNSRKSCLVSLCETRWVERHDSVLRFADLYKAIVHTLEDLCNDQNFETSNKATILHSACEKDSFVIALLIARNVLSFTLSLSVALQSESQDLASCVLHAKTVK